jgi:hypothetical protein
MEPTAGTSPLRKADVPVFFDNILITSRRDTLKQDNTMRQDRLRINDLTQGDTP